MANAAEQYLSSIANDRAARQKLRDAVAGDIVAAGEAAGYTFTEQDLNDVLARVSGGDAGGGGASPEQTQIGWS